MGGPSESDLASWAAALEGEIESLAAQIAPLRQRLEAAREQLELVRKLHQLSTAGTEPGLLTESPASQGEAPLPGSALEDEVAALLEQVGQPLHIAEIRDRLIGRGVTIPGKGDEANVIVRLRRETDRFVRTGRGMYGLASWGLEPAPPVRKTTRRRRSAGR